MKRVILMTVMMMTLLSARAQMAVVDVGNIAQGTAANVKLASQIKELIEQGKKLDESLDFMRKVAAGIRNVAAVKELAERNVRLTRDCTSLLKEVDSLDPGLASSVSRTVESILSNNATILSLSTQVLSTNLKMNDNERLQTLTLLAEKMRVQQRNLALCRHHVETGRDIKRMYDRFRK